MKASALEFRLRYLLHGLVYTLGFWAPWNYGLHLDPPGPNSHTWGLFAATLSKSGTMNIGTAFDLLLALGIVFAVAGAGLRTWGSAYLGAGIVQDGSMHAGVVADGPYRHLRNPLYLGTFLHSFTLTLLMPPSGAIWTIVLIGVMQIRLILGEEAFLTGTLGAPYTAYCALVPRLVPSLKPRIAAAGKSPAWGQAFLGELYMWGVACSFAFAGWNYNARPLIQCVIVSLGLSLVARAFIQGPGKSRE